MPDLIERSYDSLTLREAMAWDVMQVVLEHELKNPDFVFGMETHTQCLAIASVALANAMIAELERTAPKDNA